MNGLSTLFRSISCLAIVLFFLNTSAAASHPNVIVVFIDDFGWGDIACYGGAGVPTPNLDRLARDGLRFTQFYVASPICSPSRCGLLTGQFPQRWKITSYLQTKEGNRECGQVDFLDPKAPNYVRSFKDAGYATAHIGKWHLGGGRDVVEAPKFRAYGYDIGLGTYESPEPAASLGLKSTPWDKETEPQQVARHDRTRWMVDASLHFAEQNRSKPWLINLWLDDTHTPFRPSDEQRQRAEKGIGTQEYRAVLQETDHQIGRLLDGLTELKCDQNTIVILAGDNGPQPSFQRARTNGLRGMKWSLYEGGIRTPLIVRWPGIVPAGEVNETLMVSALDIFPTLCSLAEIPISEPKSLDGEDVSAAFRGKSFTRRSSFYWEYGRPLVPQDQTRPHETKRSGGFPYPNEPDSRSPNVAVREGNWKLLVNSDGSMAELYNLALDRNEERNLANAEPEIVKRLTNRVLAWRATLP